MYQRVRTKLTTEPVEDLRVDFEDGYGPRGDDEEDTHCLAVARELARAMADHTLPPFVGIRVKSFSAETTDRALRTLDLTLTTLVATTRALPERFVVTLPKVVMPAQVTALVECLAMLERALGLRGGSIGVELMVEATQTMLSPRGEVTLAALLDAAAGRCVAAHFGAYDYTAGCNVASGDQHLGHPWCEHARHLMQLAFAGTGVRLSDGATTTLPVEPHRAKEGATLTDDARAANRATVHRAWRLHADNIARALTEGYGQGWDLHPAQLPARYGAVYDYYLRGAVTAGERLRAFVTRSAQATRVGAAFDDAATAQAMVNFFLRAIDAGALTEDEAASHAGVTVERLRTRSFAAIAGAR